ncbi:lysyl-tRNA synthetase [Cyclospora cayetanensis]|uniref:Lysyl-tRNA synthetase n=1 Tax=Cyclospora cayetanensis TaxID=88456 RepID=A0A1D3D2N8_9EIME|nr:lysyl-tRNA synthetase [Cyclospora cayetanensis]
MLPLEWVPVCDATAPTRSASRSACVGISTDAEDCKTNSRSCKGEGSSSGLALRDADFLRRVSKWLLLQSVLGINTHPTTEQLLQQQHQLGQERRNLRLSSIEDLQRRYASLSPCSAATAVDAAGPQAQPHEAACGRITSIRNGGAFFDISPLNDPNGAVKLQVLVEGDLGAFRAAGACEGGTSRCSVQHLLPLLDLGDVVLVRGIMRKTLRGELTVDLSHGFQRGSHAPLQPLVLLAKQLLPPEAVGFLQQSPASAAIATARLLLLQHIADTKAGVVLRQAPELNLKKLVIAGVSDKVLGCWCSYVSARLAAAADKAPSAGTTPGGMLPRELEGRGIFKSVNWATPFQEIAYFDAIKTYTGIELQNLRHEEALRQAEELLRQQQQHQEPLPSRCVLSKEHLSAFLFKRFVEPRGMEIADGYAELACPSEQRRRLAAQTAKLQSLDTETAAANAEDFVDCLALGLPPTAGLGVGIDRLVQLLMGVASIRDVMFLPTAA